MGHRHAVDPDPRIGNNGSRLFIDHDACGHIRPEFDVLHTPGHTQHHYSLRFDWEGYSVVIAADAAVTRDFWQERRGYFNSEDFAAATQTMEHLATMADIIVPGHDNYFFVKK